MSCQSGAMTTSHHIAVHRLIATHAASGGLIAPGTDAAIGRAQCHFERLGDDHAVTLLAETNVALFRLRRALRDGDHAAAVLQRDSLARIADKWREHTPLFEVGQLFPSEGHA
jgi:hypothetical protein